MVHITFKTDIFFEAELKLWNWSVRIWGYAMAQLVEALRYKPEVAGSIHDEVTGIFQ